MTFDGSQKIIGKGAQADASNTSIPPLASTAGLMLTDEIKKNPNLFPNPRTI